MKRRSMGAWSLAPGSPTQRLHDANRLFFAAVLRWRLNRKNIEIIHTNTNMFATKHVNAIFNHLTNKTHCLSINLLQ
jgi:hypothetical protein